MSDNQKQDSNIENNSLDELSTRVNKALEQDIKRRSWITRTFLLFALVPVIAAGYMFFYGRSDLEQTRRLVEDETRELESKVTQQVKASVTTELTDVREVKEILPELKQVARVAPIVEKNQREISQYKKRVDEVTRQQDALSRSIPERIGGMEFRLQEAEDISIKAGSQAAAALRQLDNTTYAMESLVRETEDRLTRVEHVSRDIGVVLNEERRSNRALAKQMNKRFKELNIPKDGFKRIAGIEKKLGSINNNSKRLNKLESKVANIPTNPTSNGKLQKSINSLSRQLAEMNERIAGLEQSRGGSSSSKINKSIRSLTERLRRIDKSLASMDKRLKRVEPTVLRIQKVNPKFLRHGIDIQGR